MYDVQTMFSNNVAVTATAISDVIDLQTAAGKLSDLGAGKPLYLEVFLTEAMTDSGSDSTIAVTLETSDNADLSSSTVLATIGTFAATSAIGATLPVLTIPVTFTYKKYLGLRYTVANGNLTTGKVTSGLRAATDAQRQYPAGS